MTAPFDQDAYSWPFLDPVIVRLLELIAPASVLDIGAGSGKYGRLARQSLPNSKLSAVEIDPEVVQRNELASIYDEIIPLDALDFMRLNPTKIFDFVIIGDCIEHLKKSDGLDLLNFLTYRSGYVLVVTPEAMVMNLEPFYRGHNSVWTERDFTWHDNWAVGRAIQLQMFILRGYLSQSITLPELSNQINKENIEIQYFDWAPIPFFLNAHVDIRVIQKDGAPGVFRVY